jgi:hypothetical protein
MRKLPLNWIINVENNSQFDIVGSLGNIVIQIANDLFNNEFATNLVDSNAFKYIMLLKVLYKH